MAKQIREALTILRRKQVEARIGLSRSTIYERIKAGTFPSPISLGAKSVGWLESEIDAWLSSQIKKSRKADLGGAMTRNNKATRCGDTQAAQQTILSIQCNQMATAFKARCCRAAAWLSVIGGGIC